MQQDCRGTAGRTMVAKQLLHLVFGGELNAAIIRARQARARG